VQYYRKLVRTRVQFRNTKGSSRAEDIHDFEKSKPFGLGGTPFKRTTVCLRSTI
jgi:hypothetical protein